MGEVAKGCGHWSTNERVVALILLSVLAIFLVVWGFVLYEPPTGPGLCGAFGPEPCPGREALNFISATGDSPTNITVQIVNVGTVEGSLIASSVLHTYSHPYVSANWSGPNVAPNAYANITLVNDGKAFTFHSGSYYNITMISSRNNQFTSTLKA